MPSPDGPTASDRGGLLSRLVRDPRTWGTVRAWRHSSFWFRLRTFGGGNNVFRGSDSLPTAERIIAQRWPDKFPRLSGWARWYLNGYLNTAWQVPRALNSAMGNKFLPKLVQYEGSGVAVVGSWSVGKSLGDTAAERMSQEPDESHP